MAGTLKSFLQFLDSEKAVREAQGRGGAMRSFARPFTPSLHAPRLAQSYLIEMRVAVVEEGVAQIWSVGEIVRAGDGVDFRPADSLAAEIRGGQLRCGGQVKEFFGLELTPGDSHNASELFEAIAAGVFEKDPGLEKLRATRQNEGAMQALWMVFGAAVHDQVCRHLPIELETIGTFVPVERDPMVQFIPDQHLLDLIAGDAARDKFKIEPVQGLHPSEEKPPSATWHFLDEERDLYPSDDQPLEGMIRDLGKAAKGS